ncbi:Ceramide synthase 5 [Echinococcus granulosus]|nr:Ceramide synthase 5 [Echinococcus granulosus]
MCAKTCYRGNLIFCGRRKICVPRMLIGTFFNSTRFWSEEFWLPPKESWGSINAPQTRDFIYGIFSAIILCVLRVILHNCVFTPIGLHNGLRLTKSQEVPNIPLLEEYYQFNKRPPFNDIRALSKKLDVSDAKVSYWFRAKRNSVKFPIIVKFAESGWRFSFYFCLFSYGICCLYQEPFLYDTSEFFRAYPHHEMSRCIFWYYMIELAYYVSGLIWVFVEVKRKDFIVMLTHHVVTVALISFSYLTNYFRIGSVIMLLHDSADFWLEAAKMFKYLEKFWPCMACFTTFICVWIATRLYYYPFRIIASLFYDAPVLIGFYPALSAFAVFLITLQLLHIFWTVQIIRTAVKPFTTGQLTSDARSDSEMSDTANDCTTGIHANGVAKAR